MPNIYDIDFTWENTSVEVIDYFIINLNFDWSLQSNYTINNISSIEDNVVNFDWSLQSNYISESISSNIDLIAPYSDNSIGFVSNLIYEDLILKTTNSDYSFENKPLDVLSLGLQANFYFDNKNEYIETTLGRSTINGSILNTGEVGKLNTGVTYLLLNHGLQLNKALTTILINHGTQLNKSVAYALLQSVPTIEKASITVIAGEAVSFNKPKPHINFINT